MEEIINQIKSVLNTLNNEKEALKQTPSTSQLSDKFDSNYKDIINTYADEYMESKHHELTVNNSEFYSVWSILSYEERKAVITLLQNKNQNDLADKLKQKLVIFEDLKKQSDEILIELTRTLPWQTFVGALKLTGDRSDYDCKTILKRLFSILPDVSAAEFQDDIDFTGPIPLRHVMEYRQILCEMLAAIIKH